MLNIAICRIAKPSRAAFACVPEPSDFVGDKTWGTEPESGPGYSKSAIDWSWRFVANKPKGDPCNRAAFQNET